MPLKRRLPVKSKAIKREYGGRTVLDIPELSFEAGRIYAVMGANGSGKSTFAKAFALENMQDGDFEIGYMPQKNYAFRMSVKKNVLVTGVSEEKAVTLIERLGLKELSDKNAKTLSGGETAKLALARVLGKYFDMLILDEPTAAMDVESTLEAEKMIKEYSENEKAAVILITHSSGQALRICDEVIFLHKGKICERGPAADVINNPKTKEAKAFLSL